MRRIISVSSGKGGVGKTTFAVNFALTLSRVAPTVLVDLDTGTSSVRNTIDVPVKKDLYHFFRKGARLDECLTTLDSKMDPEGKFKNFAFLAAPKHAIDEITNMRDEARWRLAHAINELPASFVVLDLRAGLDANVLDFLPFSNSGILVFTPHHPAATLAAGDIVKSLLFRKLRTVFSEGSPLFEGVGESKQRRLVQELLNKVEDAYDDTLPNLDAFLTDLYQAFGANPYFQALAEVLGSFSVYFVLNMFNGIMESYETAVKPFVDYLTTHVSAKLRLVNLGWVVQDRKIHEANCSRRPILLQPAESEAEKLDPVMKELAELESTILGLPEKPKKKTKPEDVLARIDPTCTAERQLELLNEMYRSKGTAHVRENFAYIAHRALHVIRNMPPDSFGHPKLFTPFEIFEQLRMAAHSVSLTR